MQENGLFYGMKPVIGKNDKRVELENLPDVRNEWFEKNFQYNQIKQGYKSGCVFFAAANAVSSNYGDDSWINWDELADMAKEYNRKEGEGMTMFDGSNLIVHYFNKKHPDDRIKKIRIDILNEQEKFWEALNKGYTLHNGYAGTKMYNSAMLSNCIITEDENIEGNIEYYHSICLTKKDGIPTISVIDSYDGRNCNVYYIEDFIQKVENNVYFDNAYIYVFEKEEETQKQKDIANIELALELGITNYKQNLDDIKNGIYTDRIVSLLYTMRTYNLLSDIIKK